MEWVGERQSIGHTSHSGQGSRAAGDGSRQVDTCSGERHALSPLLFLLLIYVQQLTSKYPLRIRIMDWFCIQFVTHTLFGEEEGRGGCLSDSDYSEWSGDLIFLVLLFPSVFFPNSVTLPIG